LFRYIKYIEMFIVWLYF